MGDDMEKKYISLTFDDGPTIGITDQVLDILESEQISASFFVIGQQITPETEYLVKRAHDMGCSIENHSWKHLYMTKLSEQEILEEIKSTTDKIIETVGEKPMFFRPPYIDYDQKMYNLIDLAFICGHGCNDWDMEVDAQTRIDMVLGEAAPGNIILVHDMADNIPTIEAIKVIIPTLKAQGYEFVNIRELFDSYGVKPERNRLYDGAMESRD